MIISLPTIHNLHANKSPTKFIQAVVLAYCYSKTHGEIKRNQALGEYKTWIEHRNTWDCRTDADVDVTYVHDATRARHRQALLTCKYVAAPHGCFTIQRMHEGEARGFRIATKFIIIESVDSISRDDPDVTYM